MERTERIKKIEKLKRELQKLAVEEIQDLVEELPIPSEWKEEILSFTVNSVAWNLSKGNKVDLRVYLREGDKVKYKYVQSYPLTELPKLQKLAYLYRLVRILDEKPRRGPISKS